jgi:hypothetical protein
VSLHGGMWPFSEDSNIRCIVLSEPFFYLERGWIPCPPDSTPSLLYPKWPDGAAGDTTTAGRLI